MKYHGDETGPGVVIQRQLASGNFSVPVFKLLLPGGSQEICPVYHPAYFEADNKILS